MLNPKSNRLFSALLFIYKTVRGNKTKTMAGIKDVGENLKSTYSLISERNVLAGFYFGIVLFATFLATSEIKEYKDFLPWILIMTLIFGIIISNIAHELLLSVFRFISSPVVRKSTNKVVAEKDKVFINYKEIRKFRELFLSSDDNLHLKTRIKKDEKLRQTLTSIASTNIVNFLFQIAIINLYETRSNLITLIFLVMGFIFISTLIGIIIRAQSLGRHIGIAYLKQNGG